MMPETMQYLLIFVISSLTIMLLVIGIYFVRILQEVRIALQKTNTMLDDAKTITNSVAEPVEAASDFLMGLKKGFKIIDVVDHLIDRRREKNDQSDKKE